jgi:uncharacterized protein YecT (DUF1311 family)
MKSILSILIGVFVIFSGGYVNADQKGYCSNAQTTADLVKCISNYLDTENKRLEDIYSVIQKERNDDLTQKLRDNQNRWITYRDEICALEGLAYKGGSLQRVQELDCRARMAANRIDNLQVFLDGLDGSSVPEYSNPPRWINVLVNDYPEIYWALGKAEMTEADCDGVHEYIVQGVRDNGNHVIAIADSELTGRPDITLLSYNNKNAECGMDVTYMSLALPQTKPMEGDETNAQCDRKIIIETKQCGRYLIEKNETGSGYNLTPYEEQEYNE